MNDQLPAVAAQSDAGALMQIIARAATDAMFDVAKLEKLLQVRERWEAAEARKAFVVALNTFKAAPPTVTKNKQVRFTTDRGTTEYRHATLDNVCEAIGEALSRHGLSHRWDVVQDKDAIRVACVLTHVLGHSERVSLEAMPDKSGSKNGIQAVGSTVTYLQRYTLLSVTGMATTEQDDDGRGAGQEGEPEHEADPWTDDLLTAASAAAKQGMKAYGSFWKAQAPEFRKAAVRTKTHADFKALASEGA